MSVISGKDGTIYSGGAEVDEVSAWRIKTTGNVSPYATNKTAGWKAKIAGVKDWSGSFSMKDKPSFESLDALSLVLYDGVQYTWTGAVVVQDIDNEVDMNDGAEIGYEVTFEGNGALALGSGSAP